MDEDDEFLYGSSNTAPTQETSSEPPSINLPQQSSTPEGQLSDGDEAESIQESDESDVEIIMEPTVRSVDFRSRPAPRPHAHLTLNARAGATSHDGARPNNTPSQNQTSTPPTTASIQPIQSEDNQFGGLGNAPITNVPLPSQQVPEDTVDTSTLPPVTAPQSHPSIDPAADGTIEGRSIIEVDLAALSDKPWRKPGSDISDWFNYGFDEISWEAYCYRRRDVGDLANVLKTSVLTFTNLPEDQISQLPPEIRQMVMSGTSTMISQNAAAAVNGFPHPGMMDMGMMGNPMDIGMGMMIHPDAGPGNMGAGIGQQNGGEMPIDSGEYVEPNPQMQNQFVNNTQPPSGPEASSPIPGATGIGRGNGGTTPTGPNTFANRPAPPANAPSGPSGRGARGGYIRGRGRGYIDTRPPPPQRPVSPLPANVPTGPRSQNKYKDKDRDAGFGGGNESLDYGGGSKDRESEERDRGRKRRGSPTYDERSTKRR